LWQTRKNNASGFFTRYDNNIRYLHYGPDWLQQNPSEFSTSTWYSGTVIYGTNSTELYQDGILSDNIGTNTVVMDSLQIGARLTNNNYMQGDIAELIYYNYDLNDAERIIVENYLGAKYGIDITTADRYAYESNHGHDVSGIGRIDASNQHTNAQSAGIIAAGNATSLEDSDYILFGHDSVDYSSWTTTEAPNGGTNTQRIAREWRFDGNSDYFENVLKISNQNITIFTVFNLPVGTDGPLWQTRKNNASGFFTRYDNNIRYLHYGPDWLQQNPSEFSTSTWYSGTVIYGTNSTELYQDGILS
ncbi:unnamed protein product, partial [marine sediment metagenome]